MSEYMAEADRKLERELETDAYARVIADLLLDGKTPVEALLDRYRELRGDRKTGAGLG